MRREDWIEREVARWPPGRAIEVALEQWQPLLTETISILGKLGVDSIYDKSLILTHHQLPTMGFDLLVQADHPPLSGLKASMAKQTEADGCRAMRCLLINFTAVMAILIGESLTERLLQGAWGDHPDHPLNAGSTHD